MGSTTTTIIVASAGDGGISAATAGKNAFDQFPGVTLLGRQFVFLFECRAFLVQVVGLRDVFVGKELPVLVGLLAGKWCSCGQLRDLLARRIELSLALE